MAKTIQLIRFIEDDGYVKAGDTGSIVHTSEKREDRSLVHNKQLGRSAWVWNDLFEITSELEIRQLDLL